MHSSLLSTYLLTSSLVLPADSTRAFSCRPIPGDHDWPSDDAWADLNKTVSGRLVHPHPAGCRLPSGPGVRSVRRRKMQCGAGRMDGLELPHYRLGATGKT